MFSLIYCLEFMMLELINIVNLFIYDEQKEEVE